MEPPQNTAGVVGSRLNLYCRATVTLVKWTEDITGSKVKIARNGNMDYTTVPVSRSSRYSALRDNGLNILTIDPLETEDAGRYGCQDTDTKTYHYAEVVVLGRDFNSLL